jgi:hypothetical protein
MIDHLRENADPKAFSVIDPVILRAKLALLIKQNQLVQKKQSEDWYADENSLDVPEKAGEKSQIELPNIPANNLNNEGSNNNRQNQNNVTASLNEQALNSEEKEEIVEKKEQSWLGFLSSSIGWRGGAEKKYTRKAKRGGLFEERLQKLGNNWAEYGVKQEERSLKSTVRRKNRRNVVNSVLKTATDSADTEATLQTEYDKLYDDVYFGKKMDSLKEDWVEQLHNGFKEGALSTSVSLATYSAGSVAAVTTASMLGVSTTLISGIATTLGAAEALATLATPVAATGVATAAVIGTIPAVAVAGVVGLLMAGLTAAAMTAVGGYRAGLDRAKQLHEIARDSVSSLLIEGAKHTNANINKKIEKVIMNLERARTNLFALDDEKALIWMGRLRIILVAGAAVVGAAAAAGVKLGAATAAAWEAKAAAKKQEEADAKKKKTEEEERKTHKEEIFAKHKEAAAPKNTLTVANETRKNKPLPEVEAPMPRNRLNNAASPMPSPELESPMPRNRLNNAASPMPNNRTNTTMSPMPANNAASPLPGNNAVSPIPRNRLNNAVSPLPNNRTNATTYPMPGNGPRKATAEAARKALVAAKIAEAVDKIENGDVDFPDIVLIKVTEVPKIAELAASAAAEEAAAAGENAEMVFEEEFTWNFGKMLHMKAAEAKEAAAASSKKVNTAPELPVNNTRANVPLCGTGKRVSVRDL